jgi:hypothetical protein
LIIWYGWKVWSQTKFTFSYYWGRVYCWIIIGTARAVKNCEKWNIKKKKKQKIRFMKWWNYGKRKAETYVLVFSNNKISFPGSKESMQIPRLFQHDKLGPILCVSFCMEPNTWNLDAIWFGPDLNLCEEGYTHDYLILRRENWTMVLCILRIDFMLWYVLYSRSLNDWSEPLKIFFHMNI